MSFIISATSTRISQENPAKPTPAQFQQRFQIYLDHAKYARDNDQHHDHRRSLFLEFLKDGFGIRLADVQTERFIRLDMRDPGTHRRGWIDALFRYVLFEFTNLCSAQ